MIFEEMKSATKRGLTPTQWAELDREERAMMVAVDRLMARIEQLQAEEARKD